MDSTLLAYLGFLTLVCALLLGAVVLALRLIARGSRGGVIRAFLGSLVPGIVFLVLAVLAFQLVAVFLQPDVVSARVVLFAIYGFALSLTGVVGYWLGGAVAGRGRTVSVASVTALLLIMLVILPMIDFVSACYLGDSLLFNTNC